MVGRCRARGHRDRGVVGAQGGEDRHSACGGRFVWRTADEARARVRWVRDRWMAPRRGGAVRGPCAAGGAGQPRAAAPAGEPGDPPRAPPARELGRAVRPGRAGPDASAWRACAAPDLRRFCAWLGRVRMSSMVSSPRNRRFFICAMRDRPFVGLECQISVRLRKTESRAAFNHSAQAAFALETRARCTPSFSGKRPSPGKRA